MTEAIYCANHPTVETSLRCNKCEKPICARCAVRMPTGYRCKECVQGQLKVFDTAEWYDYVFGFMIAAILSGVASGLISMVGMLGYFAFIIVFAGAPTAGAIIAEGVRLVIRKRRSRALFITISAGLIAGAAPAILLILLSFNIYGLIFQVIFLVLVVPTVYYRLSGIQLFK